MGIKENSRNGDNSWEKKDEGQRAKSARTRSQERTQSRAPPFMPTSP